MHRRRAGGGEESVAHHRMREHDRVGRLRRLARRRNQAARAQQARQFVDQQRRGQPRAAKCWYGPRSSGAVYQGSREAVLGEFRDPPGQARVVARDRERGECGILGLHGAAIEQQERDVQPVRTAQAAAEGEQQVLRAGGEGVVPDQQQPAARRRLAGTRNGTATGAGGRVEERRAEMHVGLEVGPFRPLVPGVDADEFLAQEP